MFSNIGLGWVPSWEFSFKVSSLTKIKAQLIVISIFCIDNYILVWH